MRLGAHTRRRAAGTAGAGRPGPPHSRTPDTQLQAFARSWSTQPWCARLLRAFLGTTFVYAGLQKLADPGYLHRGAATYIGTQLLDFARGSPVGGALRALAHVAVPAGVLVALGETAIGATTLLGVASLTAAVAGLVVNVVLFLSASWHVHPYFLGSDSIYAVAWAAYGAALLEARRHRTGTAGLPRRSVASADPGRRALIRAGVVGVATLFLGGVAGAVARLRGGPSRALGLPVPSPTRHPGRPSQDRSPDATPTHPTAGSGSGRPVARLASIPVGGAVGFRGPGGEPGVIVRLTPERVVAYSRVCTHAGCLVGYDASARLLFCPCHGAEFDPARRAEPISGPAPTPLHPIRVEVDTKSGQIVVPPR